MKMTSDQELKARAIATEALELMKKHGMNFTMNIVDQGYFFFRGTERVGVITSKAVPLGKMRIELNTDKKVPVEFYMVLGRGPKEQIPPRLIN